MKLSTTILAASVGWVTAHDDHVGQHVPKLLGGRKFLSGLVARWKMAAHEATVTKTYGPQQRQAQSLDKRQNTNGKCGGSAGSCAQGYCCSAAGWCGKGGDYCTAPDCQISYGSGCDGNQKPSGADTSGVARPKNGKVLYGGAGIYDCVNSGDIALTFDDGPYLYTNDLLNKLKSYGARATFFITGNNIGKGQINDPSTPYPAIIKRMHAEGHQIASHTWSHENASAISTTQFTNQMVWNEIALNSILGFFPTYMRPPYSICPSSCETVLSNLGYHAVYFDLDTAGYINETPQKIQNSKNIWDKAIRTSDPSEDSFLQIEHDIHEQVVYNLTDYILTSLYSNGYQAVTVGECLGDPKANWYRNGPSQPVSSGVPTRTTLAAVPTKTGISSDGSCGNGITCLGQTRFGTCCSGDGFCGVGDDYCAMANGCQPSWGRCDGVAAPSSSVNTRSTIPPPSSTVNTRSTIPPPSSSINTRSTIPPSSSSVNTRSTIPPTLTSKTTINTRSTIPPSCKKKATKATAKPTQTPPGLQVSTEGDCGPDYQQTCDGSRFGTCCGPSNRCSSNTIACLAILGCQSGYGKCL
ncbi:hypothetical protein QBC38DRAFT_363624 [Podospora fimiseda]|uniref:Carbohydrate Esterase Family 4 n=1 Tax=Podospora fimiseda TaxID=252190 RepID=A0AAN7BQH2_9PEZI|nr:hypothetical protein QBC38DRAFT_363624 [Podospora fimiseda]